jgi:hypothetical protein
MRYWATVGWLKLMRPERQVRGEVSLSQDFAPFGE